MSKQKCTEKFVNNFLKNLNFNKLVYGPNRIWSDNKMLIFVLYMRVQRPMSFLRNLRRSRDS